MLVSEWRERLLQIFHSWHKRLQGLNARSISCKKIGVGGGEEEEEEKEEKKPGPAQDLESGAAIIFSTHIFYSQRF